jgi:hypothetical protein
METNEGKQKRRTKAAFSPIEGRLSHLITFFA